MGKVIMNSDDFGYSRGVNYGIIDAYQLGILTSTTLMANMPGFDHAVSLKKAFPNLGVGVHLTLTCGQPLLTNVGTLTEGSSFRSLSYYQKEFEIDCDELYQEWNAQIQKVYRAGIVPTHLDSHHHTHSFGNNQEVVVALAQKYDLPVRGNFHLANKVQHTTYFEPLFDEVGVDDRKDSLLKVDLQVYLEALLRKLRRTESTEVMCHAAYLDQTLYRQSSFLYPRMNQVEFLIHSAFAKEVQGDRHIELITYGDL